MHTWVYVTQIAGLEIQLLNGRTVEPGKDELIEGAQRIVGHVEVDQRRKKIIIAVVMVTVSGQVDSIAFEREHNERVESGQRRHGRRFDAIVLQGKLLEAHGASEHCRSDVVKLIKIQFQNGHFETVEVIGRQIAQHRVVHLEDDQLGRDGRHRRHGVVVAHQIAQLLEEAAGRHGQRTVVAVVGIQPRLEQVVGENIRSVGVGQRRGHDPVRVLRIARTRRRYKAVAEGWNR